MNELNQYLLFLAKTLTIFIPLLLIVAVATKSKSDQTGKPKLTLINESFFKHLAATSNQLKHVKKFKILQKQFQKSIKKSKAFEKILYVMSFTGDIKASQIEEFRKEVDMVLSLATINDQVLVRVESRGGTVTGYGLVASQLNRLRQAQIHLTVSIDQVAASGGYLIASLANEIIAAPFACVGSIGVALELPNFNRLLEKNGVDFAQITAGKYKRTLSLFGKNTKEAEHKVKEDLELTHQLFQDYVTKYRNLDTDKVATGETWPATIAHEKGLVDRIQTSDEYILNAMQTHLVLEVSTKAKPKLLGLIKDKLTSILQQVY